MSMDITEPDDKGKMRMGYEYLKVMIGDEQTTLIYYDKTSTREEVLDEQVDVFAFPDEGWERVHFDQAYYFERITPEGQQLLKEQEQKAKQRAYNPPPSLQQVVTHFDKKKMQADVEYANIVWYRQQNWAEIVYYSVDGESTKRHPGKSYEAVERDLILDGYYRIKQTGDHEGILGYYAKYRDTNMKPK